MNDATSELEPDATDGYPPNDVALRRHARTVERRGLQHLERGMLSAAIESLNEAIESYDVLGDDVRSRSAQQYAALAMYELGRVDEAVAIWHGLIDQGWDRPTTFNFLIRHYHNLQDGPAIRGLYARLKRGSDTGSGFFAAFDTPEESAAVAREFSSSVPQQVARTEHLGEASASARLLVADNDPAVRNVLSRILESKGYAVAQAEDGEAALKAVFQSPPDLIFLDIYMPRLSGLDVLYRLRAEGVKIPVIVISGRPHATMVRDAKVLGARFAPKPLNFEAILELVASLLREARQQS